MTVAASVPARMLFTACTALAWAMVFGVYPASAAHTARHDVDRANDSYTEHRLLCVTDVAAGHYADAIAACDAALRVGTERAEIYSNRGVAQLMLGTPSAAIRDFGVALRLDATNPLHYFNRALAHEDLGDLRAAIDDYTDAVVLAPWLSIAFNNRGFVRERAGDKAGALADFARAIAIGSVRP